MDRDEVNLKRIWDDAVNEEPPSTIEASRVPVTSLSGVDVVFAE